MSYNILVVDDSAIIRTAIKKTLNIAGIDLGEIYEASNGQEALDAIERSWIDLILLDINMPVMNGVEMVDKMAEKGVISSVPVVIISTERSETRMEQLKAKGVSAYLNKPFTPESIKDVVDSILGGRT